MLAAFFALIAVVALANAAGTAVVRRRRDIAVLRAIGFTPGQSGRVVFGMMTTIALVGLAVGIPLGILVGRLLWRTIADSVDVTPTFVAPVLAIAVASAAALVLANVVGIILKIDFSDGRGGSYTATRTRPRAGRAHRRETTHDDHGAKDDRVSRRGY